MATDYYFWGTSKSGFAKREGKGGLLMHAPIPAMIYLFFLPLSFFLSFCLFFFLLVSYYSFTVSCSPFGLSFSWVPLSRCLSLCLNVSFRCLLLSHHRFLPLGTSPFSSMTTSSFYYELIQ